MIFMYPMLTSNTINPSVLPGIAKAMEMHILLHKLDTINYDRKSIKVVKGKFVMEQQEMLEEQRGAGTKGQPPSGPPSPTAGKTPDISKPNMDTVGVSPTFVQVTNPATGEIAIVGVKVVPFPLANDSRMLDVLLADRATKSWLEKKVKVWERKIARFGLNVWYSTLGKLPLMPSRGPVTGDPMKDIILQTSIHKGDIFTCANKIDIPENFFNSAGDIKKLHKMGWSSLIFADDVNRRAIFCFTEYKGVCQTVDYSYLFSISRQLSQVFEDLSDVKKASGPIFSRRVNIIKALKENPHVEAIEQYKKLNEETVLEQNLSNISGVLNTVQSAISSKSISKMQGSLSKFKRITLGQIEKQAEKINPSAFKQSYKLSQTVLSNSLDLDSDLEKLLSIVVAIKSCQSDNVMRETKNNLKQFVGMMRNKVRPGELNDATKIAIATAIVLFITGAGGVVVATTLAPAAIYAVILILAYLVFQITKA